MRSTRSWWARTAVCGLGVVSLVGAAFSSGGSAAAAPRPVAQPAALTAPVCADDNGTDFDGDGRLDVVVGVPSEDRGSVASAGAVEIRHPCSNRAADFLALPRAHAHDGFGTALAVGALNGDRYLDLAVGVPGLDVRGRRNAGGVALFYGSASGLHYATTLTQASAHVGGSVQAGARFGQTLSSYGYLPERTVKLRIGEPGRTVDGKVGAGGVVDYALENGRYQARGSGQLTLASKGVPGRPAAGDAMGASLYSFYRVGIPNRAFGRAEGAGAVLVTPYDHATGGYRLLTQASQGMPGSPERGDHFGASLAQSWIGVPGESVGSVAGAGIVERQSVDPAERFSLTQHGADPTQAVEAGDHFGAAMTETGVLVDDTEWSPRQLLVGAPGQDVAGKVDAGTVSVIGESDDPDSGPFVLGSRYGELQPADVVAGARFGAVLARNGLHTVQVGAPGARGGRLSRFVAPAQYDGLPTLSATQAQVAGSPERGDRYGGAAVLSPV